MKRIPPAVTYTVLRLLAFVVPLAVMLALGFNEWFSAIVAALVGFALSLILLRRSRDRVSADIYERRHGDRGADADGAPSDEDVEDAIADTQSSAEPAADADTDAEPAAEADADAADVDADTDAADAEKPSPSA